jgi:exodeoxyribonuclease VII small subunit
MPKKLSVKETALPEDIGALSFEQAYAELETIVTQLEEGDLSLEASLTLHARGQQLAALCAKQLEQAELKVREIKE